MGWLSDELTGMSLTEEVEGYLLGRGAKSASIEVLGCKTWSPLRAPCQDGAWRTQTGKAGRGEKLEDWLVLPLWSPRGQMLGFEARRTDKKEISRYLLPEAAWNPIWMGLHPDAMTRVWSGGDVWIV